MTVAVMLLVKFGVLQFVMAQFWDMERVFHFESKVPAFMNQYNPLVGKVPMFARVDAKPCLAVFGVQRLEQGTRNGGRREFRDSCAGG